MSGKIPAPRTSIASHALLSAALGGLLCIGATACGSSSKSTNGNASGGAGGATATGGSGGSATGGSGGSATGGSGGSATGGSGGSATGGSGGSATGGSGGSGGSATGGSGGTATDGGADASTDASTDAANDAADASAYVYCSNAPVDARSVTSSMTMAMTEAQFQSLCASNGGTFEIMPHCGGFNTCMGFSYDIGSQVLSQHTCRGLNTCGGYSCVVCGDAGTT